MSRFCSNCGQAASGNFCNNCGSPLAPGAHPQAAAASGGNRLLWVVAGIALLAVIALVLVQTASKSETPASEGATPLGAGPMAGAGPAVDISKMSPQERADRLFNRVMRYASEGKTDSAGIFAPMAIQSFEMMAPLDVHGHFDLGLIAVVAGDAPRARAEADSILRKNDKDLLGLTLAIRAAEAAKDAATRARFEARLIAAEPAERKTSRPEYVDHGADIDAALKEARTKKQ
jgi:hypothetical protein